MSKWIGVGKSSIGLRYVTNNFKVNNEATLGAAFMTKALTYQEKTVKFNVFFLVSIKIYMYIYIIDMGYCRLRKISCTSIDVL